MRTKIAILVLLLSVGYVYYKRYTTVTWGPTVTTNSGGIRGIVSIARDGREYFSWLKIPYAQPPVGLLRFATPLPVKKWDGVRDGHVYSDACAQIMFGMVLGYEDCLFLNIHAPKLTTNRPLPVIVFIHGGAFLMGGGEMMNPSYFMDEDVIMISINYRLHFLGFLSTGDSNVRGNMGLKDQVLALKWIKENVGHFGGDPNKISIFGHSAGAISVHMLTLSETSKGLFQKAISTSGNALMPLPFSTTETAVNKSIAFARDVNCPVENSDKMVECLRGLDVFELLAAYKKHADTVSVIWPSKDGVLFVPTVETVDDDQAFLTRYPFDVIVEGKAHKIPWMSGVCRDDGLVSSAEFYRDEEALDTVDQNWDRVMQNIFQFSPALSPPEAVEAKKRLREFYFPNQKSYPGAKASEVEREAQISRYTKMFTDGLFLVGPSVTASVQKKFSPVYLYFYNKTGEYGNMLAEIRTRFHPIIEFGILAGKSLWNKYVLGIPPKDYGVGHGDDFVMYSSMISFMSIRKDDSNYKFSKAIVRLIVDFTRNDDDENDLEFLGVKFTPNKGKDDKEPLMYLQVDENPQMIPEPFADRTKFWRSIRFTQLFSSPRKINNK